jgi:hypothetical protein
MDREELAQEIPRIIARLNTSKLSTSVTFPADELPKVAKPILIAMLSLVTQILHEKPRITPSPLSQLKETSDPVLFETTTMLIPELTKAERQIRMTLTKDLGYSAKPEKFTEFKIDALEVMEMSEDMSEKIKIKYLRTFLSTDVRRWFDESVKELPVLTVVEELGRLERHYEDPRKEHLTYARLFDI